MRVGLLTIHAAHNYGSMLQAYALQRTVADQGAEVELIDYLPPCIMDGYSLNPLKNMKTPAMLVKYFLNLPHRIRRTRSFGAFARDCFRLSQRRYTDNRQLRADAANWDAVILGSDQVWNPEIVSQDRAFWLDFAADSFRATYASSFGTTNIPQDYLARLTRALQSFDAIAVREPSAKDLLGEVGKPVTVTCDPVFLLTAAQWAQLERKPKNVPAHYVLLYGVERNPRLEQLARRTAEHYGIPLVDAGIRGNPMGYFGIHSPDYGPREFLYLVRHADYMATNSFHGTAFGTIFRKKCVSILHHSRGTRIRELAELADRARYILPEEASAEEMIRCFEQALPEDDSALVRRVADSRAYLRQTLLRAAGEERSHGKE